MRTAEIKKIYLAVKFNLIKKNITKASKCDISSNHQCGMEIKLLLGIFKTVTAAIEDDPKDGHDDCSQEQDARDNNDKDIFAP